MSWIIVLFVLGTLFLLAEIVLPGGIVGGIGFLLLFTGALLTWTELGVGPGVAAVALIAVGAAVFFRVQIRLLRNSFLTLRGSVENAAVDPLPPALVGQRGVVLSPLTPLGKIRVQDATFEAHSLSGRLPAGTEVEVVRVADFALEVRQVNP